jgi:hypothetical protein
MFMETPYFVYSSGSGDSVGSLPGFNVGDDGVGHRSGVASIRGNGPYGSPPEPSHAVNPVAEQAPRKVRCLAFKGAAQKNIVDGFGETYCCAYRIRLQQQLVAATGCISKNRSLDTPLPVEM